ncbi:hypothetical protein Syun_029264 [Stephania yunnanensis]|uniref:Lipoyl-binding domain-containing protein n=1 Tax=Stephania yunnanensis TaxID=152371 RepID=A0AAP0E7N0_9MAGN
MAGSNNLNSLWLAHPPFQVHHDASETMELKWDNEDASDSKQIKLSVTHQSNGNYLVKSFLITNLILASLLFNLNPVPNNLKAYQDHTKHIHVLHAKHHHHFTDGKKIHLPGDDDSSHGPSFEIASHPPGTDIAPMAGLVVKDGMRVADGQPVLVLEAMKMEYKIEENEWLKDIPALIL